MGFKTCSSCGLSYEGTSLGGGCPACVLEGVLGGFEGAPAHAESPFRTVGRIGPYEILGELGAGGMGIVYRARQPALDRWVALKVIRSGQLARAEDIRRFVDEASTVARLRHPGIVAIHDVGESEGQHYFAMELVEGRSLAEVLAARPLDPDEAARIVSEVAEAIHHAHGQGVLHRDLKPSNILLEDSGRVRVVDFGLARSRDGSGAQTMTGAVLGSPGYMSPEQALGRNKELTVRSDVYSLGAVLYETMTGRPPFQAASPVETLRLVVEQDPVPPRSWNARLPQDLETICLRCLQKAPEGRYGDAGEVAAELGRFRRCEPIQARPLSGLGRLLSWARRKPALAGSLATIAFLLFAVALVASVAALRIDRALTVAKQERETATEHLRSALLAQARAARFTGRAGQAREALSAAARAAAIRTGADAREEAAAALALPDVMRSPVRHAQPVRSRILFDPDRDRYLADTAEGRLALYSLETGTVLATLETDGHALRGFPVFSDRGDAVACRLADDSFRVWDLPSGRLRWKLSDRPYPDGTRTTRFGDDVVFDPRGRWLALGVKEGGVSFHDPVSGDELARWAANWIAQRAASSANGEILAIAEATVAELDPGIVLVRTADGVEQGRLPTVTGARGLAWSPDGQRLAAARAGRVEVLEVPSGRLFRRLETPDGAAMDMRFDPTGEWLLTHSSRAVHRWWSVREGRVALELTSPVHLMARIGVSTDFRRVLGINQAQEIVEHRFEPSSIYKSVPPPDGPISHQVASSIGTVDFSPDNTWVLVACLDEIHVRDSSNGRMVARLQRGTRSDWLTARFGVNREEIFVSSRAQGLFRYPLKMAASGEWRFGEPSHVDDEADFLLCSIHRPTGRLALASARRHQAFKLLDITGTRPVVRWDSIQAYEVAFSPDGTTVVANAAPKSDELPGRRIEVREAMTGRKLRDLDAGVGATARWSADGRWVVTATSPDRVELWNPATWVRGPRLPPEVQAANGTMALSPDGSLLAVFNEVETYLIRTEEGTVVMRLTEPPGTLGYITDMAFSHDGRQLALLRRNAQLTLWDLSGLRHSLESMKLGW